MAARKEQPPERKVYVTIRSASGRKEKLENWRYWEIVGALQWMGADRQLAYEAAKWIQKLEPGEKKTLPKGITVEVEKEK